MWTAINRNLAGKWGRIMALALAAGAAGVSATPAYADRHDDDYRRRWDDHRRERRADERRDAHIGVDIDFNLGRTRVYDRRREEPCYEERQVRVWVEPVYKTVCDRVWVEPVYRTVCDRVWQKPIVRVECERVWVPARYEERWVTRTDWRGCRVRVCKRACVDPGHFEERRHEVVVKPGCWETVERRELACEGHWQTVERQELVCAGHYEWRTERVKVAEGGYRDETLIGFKF